MEFKGFKIDFQSLAMLITALTAAYMTLKGVKIREKKRKERDDAGDSGEGND